MIIMMLIIVLKLLALFEVYMFIYICASLCVWTCIEFNVCNSTHVKREKQTHTISIIMSLSYIYLSKCWQQTMISIDNHSCGAMFCYRLPPGANQTHHLNKFNATNISSTEEEADYCQAFTISGMFKLISTYLHM